MPILYVDTVEWDATRLYETHAPNPRERRVTFKNSRTLAHLPLRSPDYSWMRNVLTLLKHVNRSAELLIEDGVIVDLWVADQGRARVRALEDGTLVVTLDRSAARYFLRKASTNFDSFVGLLRDADGKPLMLAVSEDGEIIAAGGEVLDLDDRSVPIGRCEIDPATLPLVDPEDVQGLFDAVSCTTCPLPDASPGCVPFRFPDNGCWARAHAMCDHLRREHRVEAGKAWLYGDLGAATPNHRSGRVDWHNHVAPIVRVGATSNDLIVLDPSVFCRPATLAAWQDAVVEANGRLIITDASVYSQFRPCEGEPVEKGELARHLKYFHACLLARARGRLAPPPYAGSRPCPNDP